MPRISHLKFFQFLSPSLITAMGADSGDEEPGADGVDKSEQGNGGLVQQPEREQLGDKAGYLENSGDRQPAVGGGGEAAFPVGDEARRRRGGGAAALPRLFEDGAK